MTTIDAGSRDRREWLLAAIEQYEGRLTRYAARLTADEDDARDVVQHAFLRLCSATPDEIDGHIAQWLYFVCRNKAVDLLRKNGRLESLNGQHSELLGDEQDPATAAEQGDLCSWLRKLVDQLPNSQREVIDLWLDGFSYREISDITGRTEGHLRVLAHRALVRLREHPRTRSLLGPEHQSPQNLSRNAT